MPQNQPPRDPHSPAGTHGAGGTSGTGAGKAGGGAGAKDRAEKDLPSVSTATSATAGNDNFNEQIRALKSDLTQLSNTVTQLVQSQGTGLREAALGAVGAARERVGATVSGAAEQGRQLAGQAQTQVAAMAREIEAQIERNPMTAVLVALGVGFAVGLMSRSR
jgi:ElaB/YqjD/DUF883 family membrane-anchored ribosome-binding protein